MKTIKGTLLRTGLLFIAILFVLPLMAQQPVKKPKTAKKQVKQERVIQLQVKDRHAELQSRQLLIAKNVGVLKELATQEMPANISRKDRRKWKEQTEWINSVVKRLAVHEKNVKLVLKDTKKGVKKGSPPTVQKASLQQMSDMNMQFLQLQNSMQMESRAFNAVSNALKVRHDAAMSSIRNMK